MDLFYNNPMYTGIRQMLGAFAKSEVRPIAPIHDRDETMPWELMKKAQMFGFTQTALVDSSKGGLAGIKGDDEEEREAKTKDKGKKPRKSGRLSVVGAEELSWGCTGICLALGGSGLAAAPVENLEDTFEHDPQLRHHYPRVFHPSAPEVEIPVDREVISFDGVHPAVRRAPVQGEHTEPILRELAGITDDEYTQLVLAGVLI